MFLRKSGAGANGRRARRGVAALEFGLAVPLLVILLTATVEIGYSMYQAMQVNYIAEAGLGYAQKYGWDYTGIKTAATNSSSLSGVNVSPSQFCACPSVSGLAAATCGSTCSGAGSGSGSQPGQYISVSVSSTRQSIIGTSVFGLPSKLTAQAILRQN
jgi:hypothetical protein